jgi:hypothetical protein
VRILRDRTATPDDGLSPGELAVLAVVNSSKAKRDIRAGRRLLRNQRALSHQAGRAAASRLRLRQLERYLPDDAQRHKALRRSEAADLQERPTLSNRLISRGLLTAAEALFVIIEFAFWYQQFTLDVDPGDLPGHLSAGLIALAIPLIGILAARIAGALCHRWWRGHEKPGMATFIAAGAGLSFLLFCILAIGWLVLWRFDVPVGGSLSITTPMPSKPLAMVFVAVVVGDALARIFLASEIHSQTDALRRRLAQAERRHRRAADAVLRADRRHRAAWLRLSHHASVVVDQATRLNEAGSVLILDHRKGPGPSGVRPAPWAHCYSAEGPTPPAANGAAASGSAPTWATANGHAAPYPRPHLVPYVTLEELANKGAAVSDPTLRRVADAIETLKAHPPAGTGTAEQVVDTLGPLFGRRVSSSSDSAGAIGTDKAVDAVLDVSQHDDVAGDRRR